MFVTDSGILIEVRPEPPKAPTPIFVTDSGKLTDKRPEQPSKAHSPILSTPSRIVIWASFVQFLNISFVIFLIPIVAEVRLSQPTKADTPTPFTDSGIVIDLRAEHLSFVAYIDNQRVASNTVEKCWRCDWRGWKRCRFNVFNAILIQDDNLR